MAIGAQKMEYEVLEGWEQIPDGWSFVEVAGVAMDSRNQVYVFNRARAPVDRLRQGWHLFRPPGQYLWRG